jgi:tripartite-type tricarboxylate transporter receptor subunit TctC
MTSRLSALAAGEAHEGADRAGEVAQGRAHLRVVVKVLQTPEIRTTLARQGGEPVGSTPDQFQKMIVTEIEQWAKVVRAAGIKAD